MAKATRTGKRLAGWLTAARPFLLYGALLAAGALALTWLNYLRFARTFPGEFQIFLIAAGFLALGYTAMLVALSVIFLAIKRQRDVVNGGFIKFLPAFLMGLGISAVAGLIYVLAWEVSLSIRGMDFGAIYAEHLVEAARARGASEVEIAAERAKAEDFAKVYANPLFRMPITFTEILPVGLIVSLISALLLRNSRFMPARSMAA